jgi:predicted nucleic acid-binding protein
VLSTKLAPPEAKDYSSPMSKTILLDAGPLGLITNPKPSPVNDACNQWLRAQLASQVRVLVSEVADYEVRRELLRAGRPRGIANLDALKIKPGYLPITTPVMLKAAELWARARQMGKPTAHHLRLDADMIIAAQAALLIADGHEVTVATGNVSHLSLFVPAARWQDIN